MPILIIAMVALGVFGVIGILLFTAMILETHMHNKQDAGEHLAATPAGKH